jgi:ribonuclease E
VAPVVAAPVAPFPPVVRVGLVGPVEVVAPVVAVYLAHPVQPAHLAPVVAPDVVAPVAVPLVAEAPVAVAPVVVAPMAVAPAVPRVVAPAAVVARSRMTRRWSNAATASLSTRTKRGNRAGSLAPVRVARPRPQAGVAMAVGHHRQAGQRHRAAVHRLQARQARHPVSHPGG